MSLCRVDWGDIYALEEDLRNLKRLATVLTVLGTGEEFVHREGVYVLGCFLRQMGDRLEARFDSLSPVMLDQE